ncbi:type IV toxin-antitoxin system AbiEi family antitoxin [Pseudomonas aeruginosa]|nr:MULTISPECIES: hypothetical protein [Pseudomonas aeruginosa group]EIU1445423.1 hypothetical protein [Pseudomonas aeruginosa]EKU5976136.1 hypothetical protein [Pseudomonas aeruginosa]ELH7020843.1 hypothetical protein [Pseudomonas aeruginosa]ELM3831657.1 hypothetical protein [Pseudomonas aeruginosa]ELQ3334540.1 hypothetical protein [Pseudomonas aeruginosa]
MMTRLKLIRVLNELAAQGIWCISHRNLGRLFGEAGKGLTVTLARHSKDQLITRLGKGFYLIPNAPRPLNHLEQLANWLRPDDWFYLSLESALHEADWISQIPNRLTFMTSGRSYVYDTPVGIIEFVHTERSPEEWLPQTRLNDFRGIRIAPPEMALQDLKRVGRNLDLVRPEDERD